MAKCKRCEFKTQLSDTDIEKMVNDVRNMPKIRLVNDEEYERRLSVCKACEKFEYGSTCTLCGCVMQVRALLADGKCPYPKNSKW